MMTGLPFLTIAAGSTGGFHEKSPAPTGTLTRDAAP